MTDLYLLDKSALARVALHRVVQAAIERLDDIGVLATAAVIDLKIGYGAVVVHHDRDFDTIAAVTGQPVEWIVPAGSVS